MTMLVHATCVALRAPGTSSGRAWQAVLLRGPSGAGKSDLALRLIEAGGRLVADDQTRLTRSGRTLFATAPAALALLVDLVPAGRIERLPDPVEENLLGIALPVLALAPFEASAAAKLRLALARIEAA